MRYCVLVLFLLGCVMAQTLNEGDNAFLPTIEDSYNNTVNLSELSVSGKWIALWFYPKAMTSGCSIQAKHYTDMAQDLQNANIQAFGVSADNPDEQCQFIEELKLSGQMLPDSDGELAKAYGVSGVFYSRDTVLINPKGVLEKIWRTVNPSTDADTVLEYVLAH
jgi:thioredoxin-dependent peroxiredoxin